MRDVIRFTADDEEPDCGRCDNQDDQKCCEYCGPEYGWANYMRSDQEEGDK